MRQYRRSFLARSSVMRYQVGVPSSASCEYLFTALPCQMLQVVFLLHRETNNTNPLTQFVHLQYSRQGHREDTQGEDGLSIRGTSMNPHRLLD